jgi:cell division protein FtsL
MIRLINMCVIATLVLAAADVYKIKFESTRQAERLAKLRTEVRNEREAIASLRAEWSRLDNPARIQGLAARHLALKPIDPRQLDRFDHLPERPPQSVSPEGTDPIEILLEQATVSKIPTSSVTTTKNAQASVQ